jgi:aminobenzoyl-glutamate utilization protein B
MRNILMILFACIGLQAVAQKKYAEKDLAAMKSQLVESVGKYGKDIQVMVDQIFSYSELGFQETETSTFLTNVLRKNGFRSTHCLDGQVGQWFSRDCLGIGY